MPHPLPLPLALALALPRAQPMRVIPGTAQARRSAKSLLHARRHARPLLRACWCRAPAFAVLLLLGGRMQGPMLLPHLLRLLMLVVELLLGREGLWKRGLG